MFAAIPITLHSVEPGVPVIALQGDGRCGGRARKLRPYEKRLLVLSEHPPRHRTYNNGQTPPFYGCLDRQIGRVRQVGPPARLWLISSPA